MYHINKANISDVEVIHALIKKAARKDELLPRSLQSIYENLRSFIVCRTEKGSVVGCCALQIVWKDIAEVRSLAVSSRHRSNGVGRKLVLTALMEARGLGIKKVFTLTYISKFFKNLKFKPIDKKKLPHKIWTDCIHCVHFPDCNEEALIISI